MRWTRTTTSRAAGVVAFLVAAVGLVGCSSSPLRPGRDLGGLTPFDQTPAQCHSHRHHPHRPRHGGRGAHGESRRPAQHLLAALLPLGGRRPVGARDSARRSRQRRTGGEPRPGNGTGDCPARGVRAEPGPRLLAPCSERGPGRLVVAWRRHRRPGSRPRRARRPPRAAVWSPWSARGEARYSGAQGTSRRGRSSSAGVRSRRPRQAGPVAPATSPPSRSCRRWVWRWGRPAPHRGWWASSGVAAARGASSGRGSRPGRGRHRRRC